jgi:hypothetical protein
VIRIVKVQKKDMRGRIWAGFEVRMWAIDGSRGSR